MKNTFLLLCLLLGTHAWAQSIPSNDQPRFTLEGAMPGSRAGTVLVTFGVSMSDCIKAVEIENIDTKRKYIVYPTLDHYYVRDSDMEEIYAKIPVGKIKKLVHKKKGLHAQITVISKSGRCVYRGKAALEMLTADDEDSDDTKRDERTASRS